jgi:hypothetical protein
VIGSVKIDLFKSDRIFERISFSDVECILGLIKNRGKIDSYFGSEINFNLYEAGDTKPLLQELIVTYIALDELIAKCKLNVKQKFIINKLMEGYNAEDLSEMLGQGAKGITDTAKRICEKIKKVNDEAWKYDYIYLNYKEVEWDYKMCNKCEKHKPVNSDFFNVDSSKPDGFMNICKTCR